jgi:PAS domain S-box-containing protein
LSADIENSVTSFDDISVVEGSFSPEKSRFNVLVVDGDRGFCDSLSSLLRVVDFHIVNVYSGEEAISEADEHFFDAALIDINLHDLDGLEVLRQLRESDPEIGVLMMSGAADLEQVIKSLNGGADAFILKPVKPYILLSRLSNIINIKRLDRELRQSEANYRELFENIGDGIFQTNLEGDYTIINRAAAKILGFDGPEAVVNGGLKVWDTYMSRDEMEDLHNKVIEKGQVWRVLRRFKRRNGSLGWLETTIKTRRSTSAAVIGFLGIFRDVTDSIRYQEMLEALYGLWVDLGEVNTLDQVGDMTMEFLSVMLGTEVGSFMVVEGDTLRRTSKVGSGDGETHKPLSGTNIASKVARTGKVRLVSDTCFNVDRPLTSGMEDEEVRSMLAVPVKIGESVVAVIEIDSTKPGAFSKEDMKLMEIIAEHIGSALDRLMRNKLGLRTDFKLRDFM